MKTPPITKAVGSTILDRPSVATKPSNKITCQSSMRSIVFFAAGSIAFTGKELNPTHQSHKGSSKSYRGERDQEPR